MPLCLGKGIDADTQRGQFKTRDLPVNFRWNIVYPVFQLLPGCQIHGTQNVVGKAHIHHRRGVAVGRGQVDQASFRQLSQSPAIRQDILHYR